MHVSINVNGQSVSADIAPRTHLADFLRESLGLTGTHLGCEHGVCGACTVLLNDAPARSCIAPAATCAGARVQTIEGLDDDPILLRLRDAFTRAHALQCGFCTPGMLITARDIVRRLPEANDERIRLELAGNLCRCTGYAGIVTAIRMVLDEKLAIMAPATTVLPTHQFMAGPAQTITKPASMRPGGKDLHLTLNLTFPAATIWSALRDPALVVSCVPGAQLTEIDGERLTGEMVAALGPIRARFTGTAQIAYDDLAQTGRVTGEGQDRNTFTRLTATADFALADVASAQGSVLTLTIAYTLQGPLAQLGRPAIIAAVAAELAEQVAQNLQARLRGEATEAAPTVGLRLLLILCWRWMRRRFH
jgi:carbon-monoxide dehydrogenase small subunit